MFGGSISSHVLCFAGSFLVAQYMSNMNALCV